MNRAVLRRRSGQHRQLHRPQRRPHVAVGDTRNVLKGLLRHVHPHIAEAPLLVRQRPAHGENHVRLRQGAELEHPAPADNGRGHGDHGILRGGADEADQPLLNSRENTVALRLAPPVAFVQQQIGRLSGHHAALLRGLEHLTHVRHAAGHGVELHKGCAGRPRNNRGQRGFAAPRRPVEDGRGQPVGLDGPPKQPPRADDMPLSNEFIQRPRPHSIRQRRS